MNIIHPMKAVNITLTFFALLVCVMTFVKNWGNYFILFASFYLFFITIIDCRLSKIPNKITFPVLLAGIVTNIFVYGWNGLALSFFGMIVGIGLMLLPFILGGMGAGDVKALGALGAILGPTHIFHIFLYMGITGGVVGLIYFAVNGKFGEFFSYLFNKFYDFFIFRDTSTFQAGKSESGIKFPYAIAITYGFSFYFYHGSFIQF